MVTLVAQRILMSVLALAGALVVLAPKTPDAARTQPRSEGFVEYPWLAELPAELPRLRSLEARFPPPGGLRRALVARGSFAAWLRRLPVRTDRTQPLSWNGVLQRRPSAAVVALDVGGSDLQQCADTLIRLHAEYLWAVGLEETAAYHFTSGHPSRWRDWVAGTRWQVLGSRVQRTTGPPLSADHRGYRAWLRQLFIYAGTLSLGRDSRPVRPSETLDGGDFFVRPGSPGHALMILDVATDDQGRRYGLIAQGFTPAQELHIVADPGNSAKAHVWFPLPARQAEALVIPEWSPYPRRLARRFNVVSD